MMQLLYDARDDAHHERLGSKILYWLTDLDAVPLDEADRTRPGFLFAGARARSLLTIGVVLVVLGALVGAGMMGANMLASHASGEAVPAQVEPPAGADTGAGDAPPAVGGAGADSAAPDAEGDLAAPDADAAGGSIPPVPDKDDRPNDAAAAEPGAAGEPGAGVEAGGADSVASDAGAADAAGGTSAAQANAEREAPRLDFLPPGPGREFLEALFAGRLTRGPSDPEWIRLETQAYQEGGYLQALIFRVMSWLFFLIWTLFGGFFHIIGLFCIGAALMKGGVFEPERLHWHRRFVLVGACVGLPVCVLAAAWPALNGSMWVKVGSGSLLMLFGPLVSLGYLGALRLAVAHRVLPRVTAALAGAGRMALSVYLCETVCATFIFYHWGLGQFGQIGRPAQMGIVVAVYAVLVLAANLWLRAFRFGPVEWLWRSLTYMRLQPLRHGEGRSAGGE